VLVVVPLVFSVVTVFVPAAGSETVVVFFPLLSMTTVVVTPSLVDVLTDELSLFVVVVVTLPSASVSVLTVFPSSYVVVQVYTLLTVVHVGPLVTLDGAAVVVVVVQTPAPAVILQ
jgi:hypothetical protein